MDRALKERLIGAVALVMIAVLIVPVFLDGPSNDHAVVSESVNLPGQDEHTRKRQTIVLERDRDQPVPVPANRNASATQAPVNAASGAAQQEVVAERDVPVTRGPAPLAAAQEAAPPPQDEVPQQAESSRANTTTVAQAKAPAETQPVAGGESTTGMWAVQLGSFSSQENAERLAADLRKSGYAAFLSEHKSPSGALHRVRVGPQKDRASAEAVANKLSASGHKGQVVPHP
jgi:DedD protein